MKRDIRHTLQVWERIFFRVVAGLVGILVVAAVWLSHVGLPARMAQALIARVDTGPFAVEAESMRLGLIKGVRLSGVRLYRRGRVGPPAVEAGALTLWVDPLAMLRGMSTVQRVDIRNGELRPLLACADGPSARPRSLGDYRTELALTECRIQGVMVDSLRGRLRLDGTTARMDDVQVVLSREGQRGSGSGDVEYDCRTGVVDGHADLALYPAIIEPLLTAGKLTGLVALFDRFEFDDSPPRASLDFEVGSGQGTPCRFTGDVHVAAARYRGVAALRADAALSVVSTNGPVTITLDPLTVVRRDGSLSGRLVLDRGAANVGFDARGTVNPHLLRQALNVLSDPFWERWRFEGPVLIEAHGTANYMQRGGTDFTLRFDGRDLYYKSHPIDRCRFSMDMVEQRVEISALHLGAYGGSMMGKAGFVLPTAEETNTVFDVDVGMTDMDFDRMAAVLMTDRDDELHGRLSGTLALRGRLGADNRSTYRGEGTLKIDDGRIFMLPVFGGLSDIMMRLIPGLDFVLCQNDASASFVIEGARIASDAVRIDGNVLSLKAGGYYTLDREVDCHAQVKLMKDNNMVARLVRVLTYPISKLFEFRVRGPVDNPHWYPANFSADLLEKLGLRKAQ